MQPRSPRPGPRGGPRPSAVLLLLLLPLLSAGAPADPQLPALLQRAARAALHFLNFRSGSPSGLRVLDAVQGGDARVSDEDTLVDVTFAAERFRLEGPPKTGRCRALVRFAPRRPRVAVNVTCARLLAQERREHEDLRLFTFLRDLPTPPLANTTIPDSHGYVDPSLQPLWELALLGSSFVMWKKTTQAARYNLAQLIGVQQWKTSRDSIHFDYTVLLHEFTTQEMFPCHVRLAWSPGRPPKVKYHCWELQMPQEVSGAGEHGDF
ncbi:retinoic acid receptor responder protein 1 [Sorex fumeus]|uniref:retinoic acid receptor responder protein 1 n=1 Tax=Sorex fumeus TaxID=62283 RepID=UPI0024AD6EF0|nr:retinoic acid receptor responder protein 1 [Sorex fumeus]